MKASHQRELPPALVQVAGHDPLYDDGVLMPNPWRRPCAVVLTAYPAMPHGYLNVPYLSGAAELAMDQIVKEQRHFLRPQ